MALLTLVALALTASACDEEVPATSGLEQGAILDLTLPVTVVSTTSAELTIEVGPLRADSGQLLVAGNGVSVQPDRTTDGGVAVLLTASWPVPEDGVENAQPPGLPVTYVPEGAQLPVETRTIDRDWQAQAPSGVRLPSEPASVRFCLAVVEGAEAAEVLADYLQSGEGDVASATGPVLVVVGPSRHWDTYACSEPLVIP